MVMTDFHTVNTCIHVLTWASLLGEVVTVGRQVLRIAKRLFQDDNLHR